MTHSEFVAKADAVCEELNAERINELLELMFKDSPFWNLVKDFEGIEYFKEPYVGIRLSANPEPLGFEFGWMGAFDINCEKHTVQFSFEDDKGRSDMTLDDVTDAAINDLYDVYTTHLHQVKDRTNSK